MNINQIIQKGYDELYEEWDKNINKSNSMHKEWKSKFSKLVRDTNKFYHLRSVKNDLYNKRFDLLEHANDFAEISKLERQIAKIGYLAAIAEKDYKSQDFDMLLFEDEHDFCDRIHRKASTKIDKLCYLTKKNCSVRKVSCSRQKSLENTECCICMENHTINDLMTTCCGHTFGKSCFETVLRKKHNGDNDVTCPLCRNSNISVVIYKKK
jgi:hypothetical protein